MKIAIFGTGYVSLHSLLSSEIGHYYHYMLIKIINSGKLKNTFSIHENGLNKLLL